MLAPWPGLEVKASVELHQDELKKLGASARLLELPPTTLGTIEKQVTGVAREKAEDSVARQDLQQARAKAQAEPGPSELVETPPPVTTTAPAVVDG